MEKNVHKCIYDIFVCDADMRVAIALVDWNDVILYYMNNFNFEFRNKR